MRYDVRVGGRAFQLDLASDGRFLIDGQAIAAEIDETIRGRQWTIRSDGRVFDITVLTREPLRLWVNGAEIHASAVDERSALAQRGARQAAGGRHELRAPMPGLLKAVHVAEGDVVERDAALVTLEAMKMENELRAPARGRVAKLAAHAGTKIEGGAVLAVIVDTD